MAKRRLDDPFSGYSSKLRQEAKEFRGKREILEEEHERRGRRPGQEGQEDWPRLDPKRYYGFPVDGRRVLRKGGEFPEGVTPANLDLQEVQPTIRERLGAEWRILRERFRYG